MTRGVLAIALLGIVGCKKSEPAPPSAAAAPPSEARPAAAEPKASEPTPPPPLPAKPDPAATPAATPEPAQVGAPKLAATHLAALKGLPADTALALSVDVGWLLAEAVDRGFGLLAPVGDVTALRKSLSEASVKDFGIDVLKARQCLAWVAPARKAAAAWIEGPFDGALKLGERTTIAGKDVMNVGGGVFAALDGGRLIVANEAGMELTLTPPAEKLAKGALDLHARALKSAGDGVLIATSVLGPVAGELPPPFNALQAGALAMGGGGYGAALVGGKEALEAITRSWEDARKQAFGLVDEKLSELRRAENTHGLLFLLTLARARLEDLLGSAKLVTADDVLSTHIEGSAWAWIAGGTAVVSAIAVPAFIRYMRRSRTAEAVATLDRLYRASEFYFVAPRTDADGKRLPCAFPPSEKMTPDVGGKACCPGGALDKDGDSRCDPTPGEWFAPTWKALNFDLSEPHYFGYAYESSGEGKDAKFTVSAYADLDCDGVLSTFQRYGQANDKTPEGECALKPEGPMWTSEETE